MRRRPKVSKGSFPPIKCQQYACSKLRSSLLDGARKCHAIIQYVLAQLVAVSRQMSLWITQVSQRLLGLCRTFLSTRSTEARQRKQQSFGRLIFWTARRANINECVSNRLRAACNFSSVHRPIADSNFGLLFQNSGGRIWLEALLKFSPPSISTRSS